MKGLIEIKSSILSAASKAQLNHAVNEACSVKHVIDRDPEFTRGFNFTGDPLLMRTADLRSKAKP